MRPRLALAALAALICLPGASGNPAPSRAQDRSAPGGALPDSVGTAAGTGIEVAGRLFVPPGAPEVPGVSATVDATPPVVRWEVRDPGIFEVRGEPRAARRSRPRRSLLGSREQAAAADLAWSSDGRRWLPLPWRGQPGEGGAIGSFEVVSDNPQVFLKSSGPRIEADGKALDLGGDRVLWIEARDAEGGAGVARLAVRTLPAAGGATLEIEAVDLVGNPARLAWKLGD